MSGARQRERRHAGRAGGASEGTAEGERAAAGDPRVVADARPLAARQPRDAALDAIRVLERLARRAAFREVPHLVLGAVLEPRPRGGLAPTLCDQLRGGVTLRHASQRKLKPVQKQGDLMSEIATKLAERRGRIAAMQRHESDSDDDDSGWDDSD